MFYYGFLPKQDKTTYLECVINIYKELGIAKEARGRIREICGVLEKKTLTEDGKKRKHRIIQQVFFKSKRTCLIMKFYTPVLPMLKEYVCIFQTSSPMVHKLHDKQEEVFKNFLACYVKHEIIANKHGSQLKKLNLGANDGQFLEVKTMFLGEATKKIIQESRKDDQVVTDFLTQACAAYITCEKYLQYKLPLDNPLLRALSSIGPIATGHSRFCAEIKKLATLLPFQLTDQERQECDLECVCGITV